MNQNIQNNQIVIQPENININTLINNTEKLSITFQSKMITRLSEHFSESELNTFIIHLFAFLHYNPTSDFPINLENVIHLIGFAHKKNAKRTLENNFTKDDDYKITVLPKEQGKFATEEIMLNVETFKTMCMMAKTEKGKQIRKYYVKLETIFNEIVNEERLEFDEKLKDTQKQLQEKELTIKKLKDEEFVDMLYIAHNPLIENCEKIGILQQTKHKLKNEDGDMTRQNDIFVRLESHKSSNPQFEYQFTYETPNAKLIETLVKLLLKPFKVSKPEWFQCDYNQLKKVVDFCIMMYDNYHINDSVENVNEFISRYRSDRLVNTNKARIHVEKNIYEDYVKNCIVYGEQLRVSTTMIANDFYDWYKLKYPDKCESSYIKADTGNLSTSFLSELAINIASVTKIPYLESKNGITLSDSKRGIYISKSAGFKGFELKSMSKKVEYFSKDIYKTYLDEFITIDHDPRHKVARVEILHHFLEWVKTNNIICKNKIYCQKSLSSIFKQDFVKNIEELTGLTIQDVCKLTHVGCFVGMSHSEFPFIGNVSPKKISETDYQLIEKQVKKWSDTNNNSKIAQLFRRIDLTEDKKLSINQVRLFMKDWSIGENSNIGLIFNKNDAKKFLRDKEKTLLL